MPYNLVAISGSLRKGSYNTSLIRAFKERAPEGVSIEILDIAQFPVFNQDLEKENFPQAVADVKNKIKASDGVLISTPEYNRSIPGPLKNAVDWISRPYGDNTWNEKPVYLMSASGGAIGGAVAYYALKQTLGYPNARISGQPEFFCNLAAQKFDENGKLTDEDTKKHIDGAFAAFTAFIDRFRT